MRTLKIFKIGIVVLLFSALPAHAGWVQTSLEEVSYYGDGIVKQVPSPEVGGPESIMDFRKGTVTMVDHDSQTYTTFRFEEFCQFLKKMYAGAPQGMLTQMKQMNESKPKPNVTVKKVGKGEPLAGFETTRYEVINNGQLERTVWMAEDARFRKFVSAFWGQAADGLKKMGRCEDLGMRSEEVDTSPAYLDLMKGGWLMMEEGVDEDSMAGESAPVEELTEEDLPASTFQVPQGFRKVPLDQFRINN
ncbi:MAG: hypothetical protein RQ767_03420 [Thermovirgaceae bacterium]|nr:hypothetical protein [Thermovirgaceae bacterium]